jgi:hypothetical protein
MPEETEFSPQEIRDVEQSRRRFEQDTIARLSNVLPLDAARNEGRFYGRLIRGRPLNGIQRVGFFIIGSLFFWFAVFVLCSAFPKLSDFIGLVPISNRSALFYVPYAVISLLLGLVIIGKAVTPSRHR